MKTTIRDRVKLSLLTTAFVATFFPIFQSSAQELKEVAKPPEAGTFWLLSFELDNQQSPPYPFDPYGGAVPIYEMNGFPGQYLVGDSSEDYQQLQTANQNALVLQMSALDDGPPIPGGGEGGGGGGITNTYTPIWYTNGPETLLFDTMSSSSNGVLASWRDVRTSPVPDGMALGILIQTNCPFELTKIEAEVLLENPEALSDTEFEVGFFRNTNQFAIGMYADPEYIASDADGTVSKTLTDLGNGHWLLSVELPSYAWGTNRVVTIRTVPNSEGTMTKMSFVSCSDIVPGVTAYASDNTTTNMIQVPLPKMQAWRSMILAPTRSPSLTVSSYVQGQTEFDLSWLPGYQIGTSTNLSIPFDWQTDNNRRAIVEANNDMRFFLARPDPTE
jgi:hypothetical protein